MSLADKLLLDFSSDEEDADQIEIDKESGGELEVKQLSNVNLNLTTIEDITKVSTLQAKLEPVIQKIYTIGDHVDQEFIMNVNGYIQDITAEISMIHQYIVLHYHSIFPELDSLILSPVEYARTVKLLGVDIVRSVSEKELELKSFLPKEKLLVITMSTSLKQSEYEVPDDITHIIKACDLTDILFQYQQVIMKFVSAHFTKFTPNLSSLIGPHTTAQLISSVGSLQNLALTPSCNLALLGNKRQLGVQGYVSQVSGEVRLQGYLYENEFIQQVPDDFKTKLLRMLSGKIILCARIDLSQKGSDDGSHGLKFKEEISNKLEKLMRPPDQLKVKLLPLPLEQKSKKRGGKRINRMKKNFETTDLQKLQNKMSFGEREESYIDGFGEEIGLGMAGRSNTGALRKSGVSSLGPKLKLSKKMASRLENSNNGNNDTFSFDTSSLTNTQLQPAITDSGKWFNGVASRKRDTEQLQNLILKKLKKN